jgi:hypothetical protein
MARGPYLSEKQRQEWRELLRLSERHFEKNVRPTRVFVDMYRSNAAHWTPQAVQRKDWGYEKTTANLVYQGVKNTLPRSLIRHPRVLVLPRRMATARRDRLAAQPPGVRYTAALAVQHYLNWRVREFDFKAQAERVQLDNYLRGMGLIRHGFAAPEDVSYLSRDKEIEFSHHQHIRPGWPFAVHWPLEELRLDPLARSPEELQWVAFRDMWRLEDLKKFPKVRVPEGLAATVIAGINPEDDAKTRVEAAENAIQVLGRCPILEIWDRRTHRTIWWSVALDQEIGLQDWSLEWEGTPITLHADSPINEEIAPISEQDVLHELQQQLNKLLSMVLVYAKRGVSLIGAQKAALSEEEVTKVEDAEILEVVLTKTDPNQALVRLDLAPIPQTLLMSIQQVREFMREISGQGRISHGTRENVESGTEAAGIIEALEVRNQDRRQRLEDFLTRMVRKDWQVFQQTATEDIYVDVLAPNKYPEIIQVDLDQIRQEYDLQIEVGSTAPENEFRKKQEALQVAALTESPLAPYLNPAFFARHVIQAYGMDIAEAMNSQEAAELEKAMQLYLQLVTNRSQGGGQGASLGAALDSTKASPESNAQRGLLTGS